MKVLIVAGGTGGHLYPGIALARALAGHEVVFVVRRGDICRGILQKEGFSVREIAGQGLPRTLSLRMLSFPFQFARGWVEALVLLLKFKPDRVAGMGGYLCVPVILLAHALRIRTLLHEQNVLPGLANRVLRRWVDSVAISFPDSLLYLKGRNVWVSGLPIRPEMGTIDQGMGRDRFGLRQTLWTVFVFGGSLGARRLNSLVVETWPLLLRKGFEFQVLHVAGMTDFDRVEALYRELALPAKVLPYCYDMAYAYAAADVVLCRAGASTVAELLAVQRPALLVPYPFASNRHQDQNALVIEKYGLGKTIQEDVLQPGVAADFIAQSATERSRRDFERAVAGLPRDLHPALAASRLADRLMADQV
jgi:UDP-N-acetylglucosamine--N-acetylmuramyl-(pentapeptide) pyrophosphoryl-undecaprenol N-acetylglucosamine transferase